MYKIFNSKIDFETIDKNVRRHVLVKSISSWFTTESMQLAIRTVLEKYTDPKNHRPYRGQGVEKFELDFDPEHTTPARVFRASLPWRAMGVCSP